MPIFTQWHASKQNVLLMKFAGTWELRDLENAILKACDMARQAKDAVYTIVFADGPVTFPPTFRLPQLAIITNNPKVQSNVKRTFIVAYSCHIRFMFNIYFRISPNHRDCIEVVDNFDEALDAIEAEKNLPSMAGAI